MQVYSRSIVMHFVSGDFKLRYRQTVGVHHRAAALRPRASDKEDPIESIVMNFAVGDAAGVDREFSVAVVYLNPRAVVVMHKNGIHRTSIRVLNVDPVARTIAYNHMG